MVVEYTTLGGGGVVGLILSSCTSKQPAPPTCRVTGVHPAHSHIWVSLVNSNP